VQMIQTTLLPLSHPSQQHRSREASPTHPPLDATVEPFPFPSRSTVPESVSLRRWRESDVTGWSDRYESDRMPTGVQRRQEYAPVVAEPEPMSEHDLTRPSR